jgi:hypothetical protein
VSRVSGRGLVLQGTGAYLAAREAAHRDDLRTRVAVTLLPHTQQAARSLVQSAVRIMQEVQIYAQCRGKYGCAGGTQHLCAPAHTSSWALGIQEGPGRTISSQPSWRDEMTRLQVRSEIRSC